MMAVKSQNAINNGNKMNLDIQEYKVQSRSLPSSPTVKSRAKIVFMGADRVGKTAIISRFMNGSFPIRYTETVEEIHRGHCNVSGRRLSVDILDTSGSLSFPAMRRLNIQQGDAFVLVYSVDSEDSFEEVKRLRSEILDAKDGDSPVIVVVGNKSDVAEDKRVVSREIAEGVVCIDWEHGFVETSAVEDTDITSVFKEVLKQAKIEEKESKELISPSYRPRSKTFSFKRPSKMTLSKRAFSWKKKSSPPELKRQGSCVIS